MKMNRWQSSILFLVFCCCVYLIPSVDSAMSNRERGQKILDSLLNSSNYDPRIPPPGDKNPNDPVNVKVNMYLRSISAINEMNMEYNVQLTFRQSWKDPRLKFSDRDQQFLQMPSSSALWIPDTFFSNEKSGYFHDLIVPNVLIRIYPDGQILYSRRISLTLACPMDLHYYPMDIQTCKITMASYGFTTEDLVYIWKEGDPVQVTKTLYLPYFTLTKFETDYCTSKTNTGEYSCIVVKLILKRDIGYYLIQIYIPSIMLIAMAWCSFWLPLKSKVARGLLTIFSLIALANHIARFNEKGAPVSYTRSIDIWTGTCLLFASLAVLEFLIVTNLGHKDDQTAHGGSDHHDGDDSIAMKPLVEVRGDKGANSQDRNQMQEPLTLVNKFMVKYSSWPRRIDVSCRVLYPVAFAFFNIIYWTTSKQ